MSIENVWRDTSGDDRGMGETPGWVFVAVSPPSIPATPVNHVSPHLAPQNLTVHDVDGDKDFPVQNLASGPLTLCKAIYHKFDRSPKCSHIIRSCPSFNLCLLYAEHCQALLIELNLPDPVSIPVIEDDPSTWRAAMAPQNRPFWLIAAYGELGKSSPWHFRTHSYSPFRESCPPIQLGMENKKHPDGTNKTTTAILQQKQSFMEASNIPYRDSLRLQGYKVQIMCQSPLYCGKPKAVSILYCTIAIF